MMLKLNGVLIDLSKCNLEEEMALLERMKEYGCKSCELNRQMTLVAQLKGLKDENP